MQAAVSLGEVLARPDVWRGDRLAGAGASAVPSSFAPLDAELPGGGWPRGGLTEILADGVGLGECSLLLPALARLREEGKWTLLVAPPHALHGPAWASGVNGVNGVAGGLDLARVAVVAPAGRSHARDVLWATEQALASGALGAVLCWSRQIEAAAVRRLQVAAAGGGALAFLFRPRRARSESSAAVLRLSVAAGARGMLDVELFKRRGPPCVRPLALDVARPFKWRNGDGNDESRTALAGAESALPAARSPRPAAVA